MLLRCSFKNKFTSATEKITLFSSSLPKELWISSNNGKTGTKMLPLVSEISIPWFFWTGNRVCKKYLSILPLQEENRFTKFNAFSISRFLRGVWHDFLVRSILNDNCKLSLRFWKSQVRSIS